MLWKFCIFLFISLSGINSANGDECPQSGYQAMQSDMINRATRDDQYDTSYFRISQKNSECFNFGIRSENGVFIALTDKQENLTAKQENYYYNAGDYNATYYYAGGEGVTFRLGLTNDKNAIYNRATRKFVIVEEKTPEFYKDTDLERYKPYNTTFWITWIDGNVKIGQKIDSDPFLEAKLPEHFKVKYIQFTPITGQSAILVGKCHYCPNGLNTTVVHSGTAALWKIYDEGQLVPMD